MALSVFLLVQMLQLSGLQAEQAQAQAQSVSVETEQAQAHSVSEETEQVQSVQTEAVLAESLSAEPLQPLNFVPPPPPPAPAPSGQAAFLRFKLGSGLSISTQDNAFSLRVRLLTQLRNTTEFADKANRSRNEFSARAVRVMLEGKAFQERLVVYTQVGISPDEFDNGSGLQDAWVSWKFGRDATLRVGQQRILFDMTSSFVRNGYLGITRAQVANEFGMVRDIGAVLFSNDFLGLNELIGYRMGVYGGQGRNRFSLKRSGFLYMARLSFRPFGYFNDEVEGDVERLDKPRLAVGISSAYGDNIARTGAVSGTAFNSSAFPTLDALYLNADALFKWKGFYVAAQYSRRTSSKAFVENDTERVYGRSGHGYVLHASAMLTNALELGGRWGQQFGIGETEPALLDALKNEFAIALNYHFFGHVLKVQAEYLGRFMDAKVDYQHGLRLQLQAMF